ncbi:MAG TPA: pyridoxal-phosphate dependent enzyme [Gemmatimonadaceae bacterium]|nr:pyridoxal-phosphate dependent enzyme [Gemmatimonadaceae bacterium]
MREEISESTVTATHALADDIALYGRFPALRALPRASLCTLPSPVERISGIEGANELWIKRDDLDAPLFGGNKVRALEFLLGSVRQGDSVLTLGGAGSTHVLATSIHARRLGAGTMAVRWPHDMNDIAATVSTRLGEELSGDQTRGSPIGALLRCSYLRLTRNVHFIPIGGSTPLGTLGHVNAGLELAKQIEIGAMPLPARVVLPVATGSTMAGIALGLMLANLVIPVIGVRVGPRIYATRGRVRRIARKTAAAITETTKEKIPTVRPELLTINHDFFGGAYGRPLPAAQHAAELLKNASGIQLDATYSAKGFAAALEYSRTQQGPTLFWLTFDGRWLTT